MADVNNREAAKQALIHKKFQPHGLRVEGLAALERHKVLTEGVLKEGAAVSVFVLPDGRYFLTESADSASSDLIIEKITTSYFYFEENLQAKEE